jgi:hypothetical protein
LARRKSSVPGGSAPSADAADEMFGKTNGAAGLFAKLTAAAVTVATIE